MPSTSDAETTTPTDPAMAAAPISEALRMELAAVEELIDSGEPRQARRELRRLAEGAVTPELAAEVAELAARLERQRDEAWANAIPAQPMHRWERPRDSRRRREAPRRDRMGRTARTGRAGDAAAAAYLAERGGVDDAPAATEPGPGYQLDYDRAALPELRGPACVSCRCERTRADRSKGDGLCGECRETGHTRESVIRGRCADITTANGAKAIGMLRAAYMRASTADRATIAACEPEEGQPGRAEGQQVGEVDTGSTVDAELARWVQA